MAEIPFPGVAWQTQVNLHPVYPGQIVHELAFADDEHVLNRGTGHFVGVCVFGEAEHADSDRIEAFFAGLRGRQNVVELPIQRATIEASTTVASVDGDTYRLSTLPGGLKEGAYVRVGRRLLLITEVGRNPVAIRVAPDPVLIPGTALAPATTVRAASARGAPLSRRNVSWGGPWSWQWVERPR